MALPSSTDTFQWKLIVTNYLLKLKACKYLRLPSFSELTLEDFLEKENEGGLKM